MPDGHVDAGIWLAGAGSGFVWLFQPLRLHLCICPGVSRSHCFLVASVQYTPGLCTPFTPSSANIPEVLGGRSGGIHALSGAECSAVSILGTWVACGSLS